MRSLLIFCTLMFFQNYFTDAGSAKEGRNIDERLYGGKNGTAAMFPYNAIVAVQPSLIPQLCGGALISKKNVLTTAECCLRNTSYQLIALGAETTSPIPPFVTATKITPHPKFDPKTRQYDICVIELPQSVNVTDKVKPIALPKMKVDSSVYDRKNITYTGFGQSEDPNRFARRISNSLRYGTEPVVPVKECNNMFRSNSSYPQLVYNASICMTAGPTYAYIGDPGDAMVETGKKPPVLLGVLSWYDEEGELPTVFTKVDSFLPFITRTMSSN